MGPGADSHIEWPDRLELSPSAVWVPRLRLLNCESRDCVLSIGADALAFLQSNGSLEMHISDYIVASCSLDLCVI